MARGVQVAKMGTRKRKRSKAWGTEVVKKAKTSETRFRSYLPGISRPDFGFPDKMVTRLRYCDTYAISGAVGAIGNQIMRMNSVFDPDLSGVGHQPMWFDQYASIYGRYRVLGSKIKATFSVANAPANALASNFGPVLVGIQTQTSPSLLAGNTSALMETANDNWTMLCDKAGGNNAKSLTATYSPVRDLGVDGGDDTIAASVTTNPSQQFYAHVYKVDQNGSSTITVLVEVEYLVEFFSRNEIAQS